MITETLRLAAASIREGQIDYAPGYRDLFEAAIADWLDAEAEQIDQHLARQTDPERRFQSLWTRVAKERHAHALTVARAWLGEDD